MRPGERGQTRLTVITMPNASARTFTNIPHPPSVKEPAGFQPVKRASSAPPVTRLGRFEGRGWRGFHHHATLCIVAYGFLVSERETIPASRPRSAGCSRNLPFPTVTDPEDPPLRPERTSQLDRNHAPRPNYRPCQKPFTMPMLPSSNRKKVAAQELFMTQ